VKLDIGMFKPNTDRFFALEGSALNFRGTTRSDPNYAAVNAFSRLVLRINSVQDLEKRHKMGCLTRSERFIKSSVACSPWNMIMDRPGQTKASSNHKDTRAALVDFLRGRNRKARFMTELYAALGKIAINAAKIDHALAELESEGAVMVRDHFCADPHLAGVDLRVITVVESREGEDPQLGAIRRIDETWNKWLNEYLANHRCG
jgi:hypothetical protein